MKNKSQEKNITKLAFLLVALMFVYSASAQHKAPWHVPKKAIDMKNPFPVDVSSLERGKHSYELDCVRCHGKVGKGDGLKAEKVDKPISDLGSDFVQNQKDGELFWKISEARRPMPLTGLTNDQRWDIVNYIRSFKKNN